MMGAPDAILLFRGGGGVAEDEVGEVDVLLLSRQESEITTGRVVDRMLEKTDRAVEPEAQAAAVEAEAQA